MSELIKKAKFKTLRALDDLGIKKFEGESLDPCEHSHILRDDKDLTNELEGDGWSRYTEDELQAMYEKGKAKLERLTPQRMGNDEALPEANVIVDICCVHCSPYGPSGTKLGWISEDIMRSTVHSLNDAFRNKGSHQEEDGVDTFINFGPGNFRYLDGEAVWGQNYKDEGINYDFQGTGPSSGTVIEYIKKNVMNSWQDPTRYLIVVYHRLHGAPSVAGYAWLGQRAESRLAGHFCKDNQMGDRNYLPEGQSSSQEAKTPIHEVGHSFGLLHTFNNTNECGIEVNPLAQGDRVADTPPHTRFSRCGTSIFELPSASHMSYAPSTYRRLFSQGQVDRMRSSVSFLYEQFFNNPFYDWDNVGTPPVLGCTDPEANNYNPDATQDDGSCVYLNPPKIVNITQPNPVSGNQVGTINVDFQNADTITVIATNADGSVSTTHTVIKGEQPPVDPNLVASFSGENFGSEGWIDSISGNTAIGLGELVTDADGTGVRFRRDGSHFVDFEGLTIQDYSVRIVCKAEGVMDNIRSLFSKRVRHSNNESWLFLFTWMGDTLRWDNTTNANRVDSGYIPPTNEVIEIILSRDKGLYINGNKIADKGNPNLNVVNSEILRIGADYVTEGRGFGGIIYNFDIYDNSNAINSFIN